MSNLTCVAFVAALSSSLGCEGIIGVCTSELNVVVEPADATIHVGQSAQFS
jgi:aspartate/glutamate racemase